MEILDDILKKLIISKNYSREEYIEVTLNLLIFKILIAKKLIYKKQYFSANKYLNLCIKKLNYLDNFEELILDIKEHININNYLELMKRKQKRKYLYKDRY